MNSARFAARLIRWQSKHGRHDLPWQSERDPYRIWLSEIMLQQTRVSTVIPYYERFLERFPDVRALARVELDEVLTVWSGLGYYARARNLHAAARAIIAKHGGRFPRTRDGLESLPGIGRSTAAAIAAFAYGRPEAILDGNVKRVFARYFAVPGYPGNKPVEDRLWRLAESLLPVAKIRQYTQALMDLGATVCTRSRPACAQCPLAEGCAARRNNAVERYPQPRARKALPLKRTSMLLLRHHGEMLLEKRAAVGVWGGLWCLPEMPEGEDADAYCQRRFGAQIGKMKRLARLRHGFTHFGLDIYPLLCEVRKRGLHAGEPGVIWLPLEDAAQAAIPAPVRKLLGSIREPALVEEALQGR